MFGSRTSRKKTSMKSRPSTFTVMSRKSRDAGLRKASASRKSRRASTSRFYSRQKSRMSDQPLPKLSIGELSEFVEPKSVFSDAPDAPDVEGNLRAERQQKKHAAEKKEELKRKERATIEKQRREQEAAQREAAQRKADHEYGKYSEPSKHRWWWAP